jgi:hypothetical protein
MIIHTVILNKRRKGAYSYEKEKEAAIIITCIILGLLVLLYIIYPGIIGLIASTRVGAGDETPP